MKFKSKSKKLFRRVRNVIKGNSHHNKKQKKFIYTKPSFRSDKLTLDDPQVILMFYEALDTHFKNLEEKITDLQMISDQLLSKFDTKILTSDFLKGKIQDLILVDILQLICNIKKTGILKVTDFHDIIEITISKGKIINAVNKNISGMEALEKAFRFSSGVYSFCEYTKIDSEKVFDMNSQHLIMEACRIIDEEKRTSN